MTRPRYDETRENRIVDEIIVDCYEPEEQALGWYYYLEDRLQFPFQARCVVERRTSPLAVGERSEVTGLAPEDDCEHDMFVMIRWNRRDLAAPLSQLEGIGVDNDTRPALEDWQYWVDGGHEL